MKFTELERRIKWMKENTSIKPDEISYLEFVLRDYSKIMLKEFIKEPQQLYKTLEESLEIFLDKNK